MVIHRLNGYWRGSFLLIHSQFRLALSAEEARPRCLSAAHCTELQLRTHHQQHKSQAGGYGPSDAMPDFH